MLKKFYIFSASLVLFACTNSDDPLVLFENGKYEAAFSIWQPMANTGDPVAQNYLGIIHYLGLGTRRDFQSANKWFEKAAINGQADAQYNLGVMYDNGEYVQQDYLTAYMWFYVAKQSGNTHSERRMQAIADEHKLFPNQMNKAVDLAKAYLR